MDIFLGILLHQKDWVSNGRQKNKIKYSLFDDENQTQRNEWWRRATVQHNWNDTEKYWKLRTVMRVIELCLSHVIHSPYWEITNKRTNIQISPPFKRFFDEKLKLTQKTKQKEAKLARQLKSTFLPLKPSQEFSRFLSQ